MSKYGQFADLVGIVSAMVAAASAIVLAFMKRAKWQPPQEAVPNGVSRLAGLLTAVAVALLYVFGPRIGLAPLAGLAVALAAVAVWALVVSIKVNTNHAYYYPDDGEEAHRLLGGDAFTAEAAAINRDHGLEAQAMLNDAKGRRDLVWPRPAQARVQVRSALGFLALIAAGASALAAAGMLVAVAAAEGPAG